MISSLYPIFQKWSKNGSVYIISDLHFEDSDCKLMDKNWISPEEQIQILNARVHKSDTLIVLGDIGNIEWAKKLKAGYKVLICGNHDAGVENYNKIFDEVYTGPLMISEKIILSHEPIEGLKWCFNIHGHDHNKYNKGDKYHLNMAANVCGYKPISLGELIKSGALAHIDSIHRITIDGAIERKKKRKKKEMLSK